MITTPTFAKPRDGLVKILASAHAIGSGVLTLVDVAGLAPLSPSAPVRLTVLAPDGSALLAQFLATAVSGTAVTVQVDAGSADAAIPSGSIVGAFITAAGILELQAAILAAVGALNTVQPTPGPAGPQGVPGPAGATGATPPIAGSSGQIQYNAGGSFAADASLTWDASNKRLGVGTASPNLSATVHIDRPIDGPAELLITNGSTGTHAIACVRCSTDPAGADFGPSSIAMGVYGAGAPAFGDVAAANYAYLETGLAALVINATGGPIVVCAAGAGEALRVAPGGQVAINPRGRLAPGTTPLAVAASAGQTAPLAAWLDPAGARLGGIGPRGEVLLAQVADADAAPRSLYFSTTAGKPAFKDAAGTVHNLT